jgi:hypothetical protein
MQTFTHTIIIMAIHNLRLLDFVHLSIMPKPAKSARPPKAPSPTNVNSFPVDGWMMTTRPLTSVILGQIGKILGYEDYYFESKWVLCTQAFLVAAVSTTVDDGESPPREHQT